MKNPSLVVLCLLGLTFFNAQATDSTNAASTDSTITLDSASVMQTLQDSLNLKILNYDTTGTITLSAGLATFNIPAGFKYLNSEESEYVLADLWANP